jgi:hypothetical protein
MHIFFLHPSSKGCKIRGEPDEKEDKNELRTVKFEVSEAGSCLVFSK